MFKNLLLQLIPSFLLRKYKQEKFYSLIKNFDIADEPDLIIAQKLCNPTQFVIDIGSNIGLYSKFLSPFASKIIAIEPVPFTFEILTNNMKQLDIENIRIYNQAISNHIGETLITVPMQSGVRNYFRASISDSVDETDSKYTLPIKTTTLDSLCLENASNISLIKCDTEDHELECLLGSEQILNAAKPAWLIEVSGNPDKNETSSYQVFELLKGKGYRAFWFDGETLFERKPGDSSVNYFFLMDRHIELLRDEETNILEL